MLGDTTNSRQPLLGDGGADAMERREASPTVLSEPLNKFQTALLLIQDIHLPGIFGGAYAAQLSEWPILEDIATPVSFIAYVAHTAVFAGSLIQDGIREKNVEKISIGTCLTAGAVGAAFAALGNMAVAPRVFSGVMGGLLAKTAYYDVFKKLQEGKTAEAIKGIFNGACIAAGAVTGVGYGFIEGEAWGKLAGAIIFSAKTGVTWAPKLLSLCGLCCTVDCGTRQTGEYPAATTAAADGLDPYVRLGDGDGADPEAGRHEGGIGHGLV